MRRYIPSATIDGHVINMPEFTGTESTIVGEHILFVSIDTDDLPTNPCEDWDGFGVIHSFNRNHTNSVSREWGNRELLTDMDVIPLRYRDWGSGGCEWSVSPYHDDAMAAYAARRLGVKPTPDPDDDDSDPDDIEEFAYLDKIDGVWIPDKCVRESYNEQDGMGRREWMVKQAEAACETYTQWCNGDVYGYTVKVYKLERDEDGEPIDDEDAYSDPVSDDSCWGYYGHDAVEEEVKSVIESALKDTPPAVAA